MFAKAGASTCTECPLNSESLAGAASANNCTCKTNHTRNSPGSACFDPNSPCPAGLYQVGAKETEDFSCMSCPAGTQSNVTGAQSNQTCQLCSAGFFSGSGASACIGCPEGTFGPHIGATGCENCLSGQYADRTGMYVCSNCSAGSYNDMIGASSCMRCDAGTFSTTIGATTSDVCIQCPAGTSSSSRGRGSPTDCQLCSSGKYSTAGAALCSACPPHGITLLGSTSRFDCVCSPGYTGPDGGPCLECLPGTFKKVNGTSGCLSCQEGKYGNRPTAASHCNDCPFGSDSPPESDEVIDCTCNRGYSGPDGATCTACPTGNFKPEPGPSNCTSCGRGWFSPLIAAVNSSFCAPCVPGKYSTSLEAANAEDCIDCQAGKYAENNGTSVCDQCEGGKYSTVVAATSISVCTDCAGGQYSPQGSTNCNICPAGKYAPIASATCIACPRDTYNPVEEATFCLDCNLDFCAIGQYRSRCRIGSIRDSTCLNCTYPQEHTIFIDHGEYNDTCPWMCDPPYKLDCATDLCKRCDPGTYSARVLVPNTEPPEFFESCRGCPEGAECDGTDLVICGFDRYLSMPDFPYGATVKNCEKCPLGASCVDGSCALKNMSSFRCPDGDSTELVGEWVRRPYNERKTTVNPDFGRFELESCPTGYSMKGIGNGKVSQAEMQLCQPCNRVLHYILNPNTDDCQRCPPGLECNGSHVTFPVTVGSEWTIQSPIMKLNICPTGYKVWPALSIGEVFDNEIHAPKQECQVCPEGMECTLDQCLTCSSCGAGKYKDSPGTVECRDCAASKYNTKIGMKSESDCIRCVPGANTGEQAPYREGAVSIDDCICALNMYMSKNRTGQGGAITMQCFKCPAAALCPDGTCGLKNFPSFACSGIGSDKMPNVVGTWIRGSDEKYAVHGCPVGHQLINETGYELQECYMCPEGKYISNSNDAAYACFNCPPSGICPNRGKPVFPESNVLGELELSGPLPSEARLKELLILAFGIDPDLVKIEDYASLADSRQAARRTQATRRALSLSAYTVKYRLFGDAATAQELVANPAGQLANLTKALQQIFPNGTLSLVRGGATEMTTRLPGEVWLEIDGIFTLMACPMGYLLVNTTVDTQECHECGLSSFTLDMFADCSAGVCGKRTCAKCPIGVECRPASNPPWMHFIPKMLKVGTRTIEWATIKGVAATTNPTVRFSTKFFMRISPERHH